jgi:hypothetical protein
VNDKAPDGQTALDFARRQGHTPVVDLLLKSGAKPGETAPSPVMEAKPAGSIRAAVERSIPLLQRSDSTFLRKAGCVSCHNNTLAAVAVAAARKHGVRLDEESARRQVKTIGNYIDSWRERALQALGIPGDADTVSYILLGLAALRNPLFSRDLSAYVPTHGSAGPVATKEVASSRFRLGQPTQGPAGTLASKPAPAGSILFWRP